MSAKWYISGYRRDGWVKDKYMSGNKTAGPEGNMPLAIEIKILAAIEQD